jgi:hypothetical protein
LKQRLFRGTTIRVAALAAVACAIAVAASGPALATGKSSGPGPTANTVYIEGSKTAPLKFVAPESIFNGEELTIVNKTNPKQVGPHTFALIDPSLLPKTAKERKTCFPGGACGIIAKWLGVKGPHDPVSVNPSKAGKPGWDTEGTKSKTGDAWFSGEKPGLSFTQRVNVNTSEGPVTLHFMCAIHPWMQGSIEVLPAG